VAQNLPLDHVERIQIKKGKINMFYIRSQWFFSSISGSLVLASILGAQACAGFGENLGSLSILPTEILVHILGEGGELNAQDLYQVQLVSRDFKAISEEMLATQKVERELLKLTGPMIQLKAGTFLMGPAEGEPGESNEKQMPADITHDFEQGKYPVTQEQVALVYPEALEILKDCVLWGGDDPKEFISPDRPMVCMDSEMRAELIKRLNEKRNEIWQEHWRKFHEEESTPPRLKQLRMCTEAEREYATTRPLLQPKSIILDNGQEIQIHAEHRLYPGADDVSGLPPKSEYVRNLPVNDASFAESDRGFKGLARGVWEVTSTYDLDPKWDTYVMTRGGTILSGEEHCRSAYRHSTWVGFRFSNTGVRLCAD
jgi:formylglycine-generating enzyme required for sulfatase activity